MPTREDPDRRPEDGALLELLGSKWTVPVVTALAERQHYFNELRRAVGDAPASTLSARLSELEEAGVVSRTVESTSPPRVAYALTRRGERLAALVDELTAL